MLIPGLMECIVSIMLSLVAFVVARVFTLLSILSNSQIGWRPTVSPPSRFPYLKMQRVLLYSLYDSQLHTWNCDDSEKAVAALPQEEFANNCQLHELRNFSIKPRWRPIVKHRQNIWKPSFCKLTMEMLVEVTPWTVLSHFVHVHCKFFSQFRKLLRAKIQPSSIIIR